MDQRVIFHEDNFLINKKIIIMKKSKIIQLSLFNYKNNETDMELYKHRISKWESAKSRGANISLCESYSGISKSTYFRNKRRIKLSLSPLSKRPHKLRKKLWGEKEINLVLKVRSSNDTFGKDKIAIILKRDYGLSISKSTVGRILKYLLDTGQIAISRSYRVGRKKYVNRPHAQKAPYKDYDQMQIGERVQIDHMSVAINGLKLKHFQAWDRRSKFIYAEAFKDATSATAKKFLEMLIKTSPIPILSLQVDGGSEFKGEFEQACADLGILLFVLPPASPKQNGGVERGNGVFREEFYTNPNLKTTYFSSMRYELKKAVKKYNNFRPHYNLKGLTPMQYINNNILTDKVAA